MGRRQGQGQGEIEVRGGGKNTHGRMERRGDKKANPNISKLLVSTLV